MNNNYDPRGYYNYPYMPSPEQIMFENRKREDKKILNRMGNVFGLAILLYIGFSLLVSFVFAALLKRIPALDFFYSDPMGNSVYSAISSVIFLGGAFFVSHLILKAKKYTVVIPLGTSYNKQASTYLVMLITPILMLTTVVINLISQFFQSAAGVEFSSSLDDIPSSANIADVLISMIVIAVIPAIIEEVCVRGIVLQPLRRYGDKFAILMSSIIFSLLHGNMEQIPYTLTAGLLLGYVAVATGSLWPGIIIHFINNLIAAVISGVLDLYGTTPSTIVAIAIYGSIFVIGIIGAIKYMKLNYKVVFHKGVNTLKTGEKWEAFFLNPLMVIAVLVMIWVISMYIS